MGDLAFKCILLSFLGFVLEKSKKHYLGNTSYIFEVLANISKRASKLERQAEELISAHPDDGSASSAFQLAKSTILSILELLRRERKELDKLWHAELEHLRHTSNISKYIEALCSNTSVKWFFQPSDTVFDVSKIQSRLISRGTSANSGSYQDIKEPRWYLDFVFQGSIENRFNSLIQLLDDPPSQLSSILYWKRIVFEAITESLCQISSVEFWKIYDPKLADGPSNAMNDLQAACNLLSRLYRLRTEMHFEFQSLVQKRIFESKFILASHLTLLTISKLAVYADETGILSKHHTIFSMEVSFSDLWFASRQHYAALSYLESSNMISEKSRFDHLFSTGERSIARDWAKHFEDQLASSPSSSDFRTELGKLRAEDDKLEQNLKELYSTNRAICQDLATKISQLEDERQKEDDRIRKKFEKNLHQAQQQGHHRGQHAKSEPDLPPHATGASDCSCKYCDQLKLPKEKLAQLRSISAVVRNVPQRDDLALVMLFGRSHLKHPLLSLLFQAWFDFTKNQARGSSKKKIKSLWNEEIARATSDITKELIVLGCPEPSLVAPVIDVLNDDNPTFSIYPDSREMVFAFGENSTIFNPIGIPEFQGLSYRYPYGKFHWMFEEDEDNENRAIASYSKDCHPTMRRSEYLMLGGLRAGGSLQLVRMLGMFDGPKFSLHKRSNEDIPVELLLNFALYQIGPPLVPETENPQQDITMRVWKSSFDSPSFLSSLVHAVRSCFESLREMSQSHHFRLVVSFLVTAANCTTDEYFELLLPALQYCISFLRQKLYSMHEIALKKLDNGHDEAVERLHQSIKELAYVGIFLLRIFSFRYQRGSNLIKSKIK